MAKKPKRPRPARTTSLKNAPPKKAKKQPAPPKPRKVKPDPAQLPLTEHKAHVPRLVDVKGPIEGCSGPVWTRLLALSDNRDVSVNSEVELVRTRKALEEEIAEQQVNATLDGAGARAKDKLRDLKSDHFDVEQQIDLERARIRWFADQIGAVIKNARQGKIFDADEPTKPTQAMLFPPAKKEEKPGEGKDKTKSEQAEPAEVPEGEDQHLAASINELGLNDNTKPEVQDALVKAGYSTVGQLARDIDEGKDMAEWLGLSEPDAAKVVAAVGRYRKKHRSAMVESERELEEAFA